MDTIPLSMTSPLVKTVDKTLDMNHRLESPWRTSDKRPDWRGNLKRFSAILRCIHLLSMAVSKEF